ncbi:MAG: GAF domain-containing protein, partial [Candidatus Omnitrophota bacterium]
MTKKKSPSVLERFLLPNPQWQEGYQSFGRLMGRPLGWLLILDEEEGEPRILRLDRKHHCSFFCGSVRNSESCIAFLKKYAGLLARDTDTYEKLPSFYKCAFGKRGAIFEIRHLGKIKGFVILDALTNPEKELAPFLSAFDAFLATHVELAYKTFELNNFYETVHPRALALSTIHSVHRVISSSLRLGELLPRIGRLSAQVLKARGCSIMLCDLEHEYLLPRFTFGTSSKFVHHHRLKIGKGLEGRIAKTGDFHLGRASIGVPFIEDDVVGVIVLWDKVDHQPFTRTDLEILKSLSEQAVVAIKNARLYEETEQLTL